MDPVTHYLHVFEHLRAHKRWSTDTRILRFAALTLAASGLDDPAGRLEAAAVVLRDRAGWSSPLRSNIRYIVAAMILRRGLDPAAVHDAVERVRKEFRARRYRRSGVHEVLAALILVLRRGGADVPPVWIDRTGDILSRWKVDHPWLTGANDVPMAALHAAAEVPVEDLGRRVEDIYQGLHRAGFGRGDHLQLASNVLAVAPWPAADAVSRFGRVARALTERLKRIRRGDFDEVAILSLTSSEPVRLAEEVRSAVERLAEARPRPGREVAFSLAAGLAVAREAGHGATFGLAADVRSAQLVLEAQQAAIAACCAAAISASAAASSA